MIDVLIVAAYLGLAIFLLTSRTELRADRRLRTCAMLCGACGTALAARTGDQLLTAVGLILLAVTALNELLARVLARRAQTEQPAPAARRAVNR